MARLTKSVVEKLPARTDRYAVWDELQPGLGVVVMPSGRKSFVFKYRVGGGRTGIVRKPVIGQFGAITVDQARATAKQWQAEVIKGGDPSGERQAMREDPVSLYGDMVDQFIELYAKPRQRSWAETKRVLTVSCAPWLRKPIAGITKRDAYKLLDGFVADGHQHKAKVTLTWLRTLWTWAWKREIVASPIMDAVEIHVERTVRDRFYSDDEVKAIWQAADKLDAVEGAYVKLLVLLAPRKSALAAMKRSHLDDVDEPTLWTTPHELTKTRKTAKRKREYMTPLPALAVGILRSLLAVEDRETELVFPGSRARRTGQLDPGTSLKARLVEHGAPADFGYHACRHTLATWLENEGHSEWERGLVLNHAGTGVTADYSHGHALALKRQLLTKWADHVAALLGLSNGPQATVVPLRRA